jgi:hypothetical protein
MMLGKAVGEIVNTSSLVNEELTLVYEVTDSVNTHVNYLIASLFDIFIGNTSCACIVCLDWCGTLWVSHFYQ